MRPDLPLEKVQCLIKNAARVKTKDQGLHRSITNAKSRLIYTQLKELQSPQGMVCVVKRWDSKVEALGSTPLNGILRSYSSVTQSNGCLTSIKLTNKYQLSISSSASSTTSSAHLIITLAFLRNQIYAPPCIQLILTYKLLCYFHTSFLSFIDNSCHYSIFKRLVSLHAL